MQRAGTLVRLARRNARTYVNGITLNRGGNTLALPIAKTNNAILNAVEGEALGTRFSEELLSLLDQGEADNRPQLKADCEQLQREVQNLGRPSPQACRRRRWHRPSRNASVRLPN